MINFISISPPRSGTHWLRSNLNQHPDLNLPEKEIDDFGPERIVKYKDLNYSGDITARCAMLTTPEIIEIHKYNPEIKLIFILRNPVFRAWSHLKHMVQYKEAYFKNNTDHNWIEAAIHPYSIINGDYPRIYNRWANVFGKENIFTCLFEEILIRPVELLQEICKFIGVNENFDYSFAYSRINSGTNDGINKDIMGFIKDLHNPIVCKTFEMFDLPFEKYHWTKTTSMVHLPRWDYEENVLLEQQKLITDSVTSESSES